MQRILVVDDERIIADTITLIFSKQGFEVRTAYSAQEAMSCAKDFEPELLLCDITMPGRDGVDLMKDMLALYPECRVLVLTGYYNNYKRLLDETASLAPPANIMMKPCQPADLLRAAGAMLKRA